MVSVCACMHLSTPRINHSLRTPHHSEQNKNLYINLVNMLTKKTLTPCVIFTFR